MFREFPLVAISRTWLVICYLIVIAILAIATGEIS
jgi:hypothetical protein